MALEDSAYLLLLGRPTTFLSYQASGWGSPGDMYAGPGKLGALCFSQSHKHIPSLGHPCRKSHRKATLRQEPAEKSYKYANHLEDILIKEEPSSC